MNTYPIKAIWTIDSHTAGEGTRLVTRGLPALQGESMAEKMAFACLHLPWAPGMVLQEPRGHKDLYGAILTEACHPEADFGLVFMNNQGFEPMCGHGLIGVVTSMIETGMLAASEPVTFLTADTPAGLIKIQVQVTKGEVRSVAFENVPSFAVMLDAVIRLDDGTPLVVDVAFGGNFFLLVQTQQTGLELSLENVELLAKIGMRAIRAANEQIPIVHPWMGYLDRITDLRFLSDPTGSGIDNRNLVILGDHMVDRSPCGTGTCAELAVRYARGQVNIGETFASQSLFGGRFNAVIMGEADSQGFEIPYPAIIPRLEGQAFLTGVHRLIYHKDDPYRDGFLLPT